MYLLVKRIIDIVFSLVLIFILFPFLLLVIFILRFTAEGEVFYLQSRKGLNNKDFFIYKFATMLKNSESIGSGSITLQDDFRVTKFGKFLRKTKINELPQLFNILKGDISIVGPRPLVNSTFNSYSSEIKSCIYNVKPGLTGVGSIFFRDEESIISTHGNEDPHLFYREKIAPIKGSLELWYQKNQSLFLDVKIIFITAFIVCFPQSRFPNNVFKVFKNYQYIKKL